MIGARKGPSHLEISVDDLAFFYDEMVRAHLLEIEIETPQGKIVLKRLSRDPAGRAHPLRRKTDQIAEHFFDPPESSPQPAAAAVPAHYRTIASPIIGVFYRASSPQSASFVKEGDLVEVGSTVCIVEAMKLMNEIKADCRCRIVRILVENAKPVTKNQPLFYIEPVVG